MCRYALTMLILLGIAPGVRADVHVVAPDGSGDFATIQEAIYGSQSGDTIELISGVYRGSGNVDVNYSGRELTIRSQQGDPNLCVVDCENQAIGFRFVSGEGPGATLEGVTIRNGRGLQVGGVWIVQSSPTIRNCVLSANVCTNGAGGGGMLACASSSLVTGCRFEGNLSSLGAGGFFCCDEPAPTMSSCIFVGNVAESAPFASGGAIGCQFGSPTIEGCLIYGNRSEVGGGGLYVTHSSPTIRSCTIAENEGYAAGGVCAGNETTPVVVNTVIARNQGASFDCGSAEPELTCCDVWGNSDGDWVGCIQEADGFDGNFSADPLFCDTANGDYTLDGRSPCLPGNHPDGVDCGLIGALGQGCGTLPTGACCFANGSCLVLDQSACDEQGGNYMGNGISCDPNPCEATPVQPTTWGRIKAGYR